MKRASSGLGSLARRLTEALGEDASVLIGALALAAHGYARATTDVDLICRLPLEEARKRLALKGVKSVLERGDGYEAGFDCLRGKIGGIRFDILPPLVPIDWDRAVTVALPGGGSLRVVDLRTLIHLKLKAGGPMDVLDVAMLLQTHPGEVVPALELAAAYGLATQLESFRNDPRIKPRVRPSRSTRRRPPTTRSRS